MSHRSNQQTTTTSTPTTAASAVVTSSYSNRDIEIMSREAKPNDINGSVRAGGNDWRMVLYDNRTLASAITAAVTGMLVGYPFDSLKTRMQTHHYTSLLSCARKSIADEGIYGLYRGLLPPLLTASAAKSMSFSAFEQTKQWLRIHDPLKNISQSSSAAYITNFQRQTVGSVALTAGVAGSIAGGMIALLCCPLELIKVQMQLARLLEKDTAKTAVGQMGSPVGNAMTSTKSMERTAATAANSNLSVAREIVRFRGFSGLYYGLGLHVLRDSAGTAIYFSAYETVKETMRRLSGSDTTGPLTHMLSGGTCGVVSWLLIFPVDLIKSTMQSQVLKSNPTRPSCRNSWVMVRDIYARLGMSGLYRGISVSLIRAFPIHGLNFVVYEWARANICWLAGQPRS